MSDLIERLRAAIDEDERLANLMPPWPWTVNADEVLATDGDLVCEPFALSNNQLRNMAAYIVRHDPARVLRMVAAHRKILDGHPPFPVRQNGNGRVFAYECATCHEKGTWENEPLRQDWPCPTLLALAEAYGLDVGAPTVQS